MSRAELDRAALRFALSNLRHLYAQMVQGCVSPAGMASAANGLLSPAIRRIEQVVDAP